MRFLSGVCLMVCLLVMLDVEAGDRKRTKCSECQPVQAVSSAPTQEPVKAPEKLATVELKDVTFRNVKIEGELKVGEGITLISTKEYTGAWLTSPNQKGMVSIYVIKGQGPVVGIHHNKELTSDRKGWEGYDLALALADGKPSIQFRKKDGSLGWIGTAELEAAIKK
jgi:hypothetical protein